MHPPVPAAPCGPSAFEMSRHEDASGGGRGDCSAETAPFRPQRCDGPMSGLADHLLTLNVSTPILARPGPVSC